MGKIIRIIRRILLLCAIGICAYITIMNIDDVKLEADSSMYIVEEYVDPYMICCQIM